MADITTIEALRAKMGDAHELTKQKVYDSLFEEARDYIAKTPLLFLATTSKDGMPTVSPKGDGPGFVHIVDDKTILIPDRPGNKLMYGHTNIIETGTIGLIFLIPGTEETLRISGRCTIKDDEDLCAKFETRGRPAELVLEVKIETCFFHCAKAFKRSQTWQPETWREPFRISFGDIIARNADGGKLKKAALKKVVDMGVKADGKMNL
ncbi:MAG: MSMEG_1061 family FMN-dependent PPOX-type flavoprotein [Alphaproteobacteria bacterium]